MIRGESRNYNCAIYSGVPGLICTSVSLSHWYKSSGNPFVETDTVITSALSSPVEEGITAISL